LPSAKRLRVAQGYTSLDNIERSSIPMIDFQHSTAKSLNTLLDCDTFIEGMQRAQDSLFSTGTTSNSFNDRANDFIEKNSMGRLDIVSTEPNISTSIFGDLSPLNHSILNPFETKFDGPHKCSTKEVNPGSFMLFGKMIHPVGSNLHDSATKGEDGCMGCNN
jgi:hypothetical protein